MTEWVLANGSLLAWAALVSGVGFVATLVAIPLILVRMPRDYFACGRRRQPACARWYPPLRWAFLLAKNALGVVLVAAGVAMLVLPGQGVLTLLLGLMMMNFPGKRTLERWLVTRPPVRAVVNHLRARAGRPPIVVGLCDEQP